MIVSTDVSAYVGARMGLSCRLYLRRGASLAFFCASDCPIDIQSWALHASVWIAYPVRLWWARSSKLKIVWDFRISEVWEVGRAIYPPQTVCVSMRRRGFPYLNNISHPQTLWFLAYTTSASSRLNGFSNIYPVSHAEKLMELDWSLINQCDRFPSRHY